MVDLLSPTSDSISGSVISAETAGLEELEQRRSACGNDAAGVRYSTVRRRVFAA
jgi:hypothetical protein